MDFQKMGLKLMGYNNNKTTRESRIKTSPLTIKKL
jgi:hypothetical protein